MRSFIFLLILLIPSMGFTFNRSTTCLDSNERDPLAPSNAPTCGPNERGKMFRWNTSLVPYYIHEGGSKTFPNKKGKYNPALLAQIQKSFQTWEEVECSVLGFEFAGFTPDFGHSSNKKNWIGFYDKNWPHAQKAIAVTTVTTRIDGTITDADIEINGTRAKFGIDGASDKLDIRNFLTHEVGHLIGLDHSPLETATMQFNTPEGEVYKRVLHQDDVDGICAIYPLDFEPKPEPGDDDGCCSTTRSQSPSPIFFILIALVFFRKRKRKTKVCSKTE